MEVQDHNDLTDEELLKSIECNKRLLLKFKSSRLLSYHYRNILEELRYELSQRKQWVIKDNTFHQYFITTIQVYWMKELI